MSEAKFWKFLRPRLKKYGHFERIESHETAIGTPDVNYCIEGYTNHLELKYTNSRKRGLRLRPAQAAWFKRRVKALGQPWLLALAEVEDLRAYVLIPGTHVPDLARTTKIETWLESGVMVWMNEIKIDQLVHFLSIYLLADQQISNGSKEEERSSLILPSRFSKKGPGSRI